MLLAIEVRAALWLAAATAGSTATEVTPTDVCWSEGRPAYILECYAEAVTSGDLETLGKLLSPDFVSQEIRGGATVVVDDRAGYLEQLEKVYATWRMALTYGPATVTEEEAGKTWSIETSWSNLMTGPGQEDVTVTGKRLILRVRQEEVPVPHYLVLSSTADWDAE